MMRYGEPCESSAGRRLGVADIRGCRSSTEVLSQKVRNYQEELTMIKVSVVYPHSEGKAFDMKYYCEKHMPMVKQKLGSACKSIAVDQGIAGGAPGTPPTY